MNRRGFIQLLAGSAATLAAGELLLPTRTFFLPPKGGWPGGWPDPALFAQIEHARTLADRLAGVPRAFYGTSDGVALTSAAHPVTNSPLVATALNEAALEELSDQLAAHMRSSVNWLIKDPAQDALIPRFYRRT